MKIIIQNTRLFVFLIGTTGFLCLQACSSNSVEKVKPLIIEETVFNESYLDGPAQNVAFVEQKIDIIEDSIELMATKEIAQKTSAPNINKAPSITLADLTTKIEVLENQDEVMLDSFYAAELYADYGEALFHSKEYKKSTVALRKAMGYGYEDDQKYYLMLLSNAAASRSYGQLRPLLAKAKKKGFRNYRALLYGSAFEKLRKDARHFMRMYSVAFSKNEKAMFKAYLHFAPAKTNLTEDYVMTPYELFKTGSYEARTKNYYLKYPPIAGDFKRFSKGFEKNMFSRGSEHEYRYDLLLANNKNYYVLIYSEEQTWSDYILPKKYCLVTYSPNGDIISEQEIGKRGMNKCKGFVLRPDHSIAVTDYKVTWRKGRKSHVKNNERNLVGSDIASTEVIGTTDYRINSEGFIVESEGLILGMK